MNNIEKKNKAKKEFLKCVIDSNYKIIGEYEGADKKVKLICPKYHEWEVTPSHFKKGVRCPKCQNRSSSQAKERFLSLVKSEGYKCFDEYKGNKVKVEMECPKGHRYKVRPNDFNTGHRCRSCSISNSPEIMARKEKSKKELELLAQKRGFKILGEYVNLNTKIEMECPNGHIRMYNIGHFKNGFGCPVCNNTDKIEAEKDLHRLLKEEGYKAKSEYKSCMEKMTFECPVGHIYETRPNDFKNGLRCPKCSRKSYGEEVAVKELIDNNIDFEVEKTFDDLIGEGGGRLRFDIYIPSIRTAIEIQGEQHFGDGYYKNSFNNDEIKRKYCIKNNINLYEIEYFSSKLGLKNAKEKVKKEINDIIKNAHMKSNKPQQN